MLHRKKILWVTPDCFLDTDLSYEMMNGILQEYDIHWVVLFDYKDNRYKESDFERLKSANSNLTVEFLYAKHRKRYPQNIFYYLKIRTIVNKINPDLIYFNLVPSSPYILPLYFWLPKDKTIVTAHDGRVTASMAFASLIKYGFYKAFKSVKHVNMFSKYQAGFFNNNFPGKDVTVIPLALKDFGSPTIKKRTDCIGFLYFGTIHFEKKLELLIEAANQLYEEGVRGFKVSINGVWRVPWKPEDKIRHSEIFELNIGSVPNEDIPNLFAYNHYAVYPYKNMSQSGAIKCAFNYHTPVIVSNLPGFTDEVVEGTDGYIFKSEDVEDLKRVMLKCITCSAEDYQLMVNAMRESVNSRYSLKAISRQYVNMFNKVLKDN